MITAISQPAAHAGEDQSSSALAVRQAHWAQVATGLLAAVKTYVVEFLQEEHDDAAVCANAEHHAAVRKLFAAIKQSDAAGLADARADLQNAVCFEPVGLWSPNPEGFAIGRLSEVIAANDWLRPGDAVYQATRHVLTDADFKAPAAPAVNGGAA